MRQPTLVLAVTSLLVLAPLVGCDEQPSSAAQRHIDDAVATINDAQLGFVPNVEESDLAKYRHETLENAANNLRHAISEGDRDQQVIARRLLSDLHAAAARATLREAGREDGALRLRAGSVINQLAAYEHAHARVGRFDHDNALTLEQLNEEIREQHVSREQAQAQREEMAAELEQLQAQRQTLRERIDEAQAEARELRDQAFVAEGDERYEMEEEADQLVLSAEKGGAEAEQLDGEIALAEADLSLIDQRIETIDELVADLESQVETVETQTTQTTEWHAAAEADRDEAFQTLREEYEQLIAGYREAVRSRFEQAGERADEATAQARQAVGMGGADRGTAQAELLAREADQVRVRVNHADAIGGVGRVLAIVVERVEATQPDAVRPFEEGLGELIDHQDSLAEQAEQIISSATELAAELSDSGGDLGDYAAGQQEWLNRQQERLRNSRLAE
ncbi:MAG: hypothetical protein WD294_05820 [Phycisphaeraceae bacterium]